MHTSRLLRSYATFVVRHCKSILAIAFIVTAILGVGVSRLFIEVDPDRQLPQDHPYIQALGESHRLFGDKNLVVIGLRSRNGDAFTPAFLLKLHEITERLKETPGIVLPLLQSIASPAVRDIGTTGDQLHLDPVMPFVPATPAEAAAVRDRVFDDSSYVGSLVSYDGSAVGIYATFDLTPQLPGYVNVHRAVVDILSDADDGTFEAFLSGPVVIASALSLHAAQVAYFFPLALLVIGLVHYDAFRTVQAITLPLITGLMAVTWAVGLMGFMGVPLDPFNSTTPVLILAVAAGHAVQILKRYYEELTRLGDNDAAIIESIVRVGGVMIAAGTIATLSFFSLASMGTDSMRTFGLFTGFGILCTLVIEMTTIPALRAVFPSPQISEVRNEASVHPMLDRALNLLAQKLSSPRFATRVLLAYLLVVVSAVLVAGRVEIDTSFKRNFAESDAVREEDDRLNELFGGTNLLIVTIEGPAPGDAVDPAALQAIDRLQRRIESLPQVGKTLSIVDALKRMHSAMNGGAPATALPDSRALASQYLLLYSMSENNDLSTRLTPDNRIAKLTVMLHDDSTSYGEHIIAKAAEYARAELPDGYRARISGPLASNAALTEVMVRGKISNILQISVITILVAAVILRSFLGGLLVAVPLAIAVLINFGAMGVFRVPLDIATAAVTAMAVGIGADYAVYLLFRVREEMLEEGDYPTALTKALRTSGKAVIFVSTAVAAGYAVLCLSGFRLFVQLGSLVGLAMVTSCLATLVVLPALLTLISRTPWSVSLLGPILQRHSTLAPKRRDAALRL